MSSSTSNTSADANTATVQARLEAFAAKLHTMTQREAPTPTGCWCGCGGATKSRFVMGHDARFHGWAKKVARGEMAMPASFVNDLAKADFMKHYNKEKAQ